MYLIGRVIEELCEDPQISALDFGLGDADYKRRLGCEFRLESDVILSAARLRPLWVTGVNRTVTAVGRMLVGLMGPGHP
jgi:CelD/BcsL family acetyltransferase involved in cellulose biosynthesis